jgi:hypothetical protein
MRTGDGSRIRLWDGIAVRAVAAACIYAALILVEGRHVVAAAADHVPHDAGDPVLVVSLLAWNATHVPLTDSWWNFPAFYPLPSALTFSEHLLGVSLIATPLIWLTGNPVFAYNVVFLGSFVLSAVGAYALGYYLTRNAIAAFLAGLIYGFAPYRVSQIPHLQMLAAWWMPVALLALHLYRDTGRGRWLALFGVSWLLQSLANGYYFVYFSVFVALWMAWFLAVSRQWKALGATAATVAVASIPLLPIVLRYRATYRELGFIRNFDEVRSFSADVFSILTGSVDLSLWGWLGILQRPESELFPGPTIVLLIVIAVVAARRRRGPGQSSAHATRSALSRRRHLIQRACVTGAIVAGVAAASVILAGPWRLPLPIGRVSASSVDKPLSLALAFALCAGALSARFHAAARQSSALWFYSLAAVTMWLLALGPRPTLLGRPILYAAPYRWLMQLPGLDSARVPARFWMITVLCLAVIAALLVARAAEVRGRRWTVALGTAAAIGLAADSWARIEMVPMPDRLAVLDRYAQDSQVLELPLNEGFIDIAAQYRAVTGNWRTFNGYSGFIPDRYVRLVQALDAKEEGVLQDLRRYGPLTVVVHVENDRDGTWARYVGRQPDARQVLTRPDIIVFRFPGT